MEKPDVDKTVDELTADLFELHEQVEQPYLTEARKDQIRKKIGRTSWELQQRNIPILETK